MTPQITSIGLGGFVLVEIMLEPVHCQGRFPIAGMWSHVKETLDCKAGGWSPPEMSGRRAPKREAYVLSIL